jgi:hypothetical protein
MQLTASMMLTPDGVYQGPGGPHEDRRDGFDCGGWAAPFADPCSPKVALSHDGIDQVELDHQLNAHVWRPEQ